MGLSFGITGAMILGTKSMLALPLNSGTLCGSLLRRTLTMLDALPIFDEAMICAAAFLSQDSCKDDPDRWVNVAKRRYGLNDIQTAYLKRGMSKLE